jgi:hypothetical protein
LLIEGEVMEQLDWDPLKERPLGPAGGESRRRYILRRLLVAVITLVGVTAVGFLLFTVLGGDGFAKAIIDFLSE